MYIREHITPILKELHWMPVDLRIEFKVLLYHVYIIKALHGQAPQYLGQLCCYKQRPSHLRQPRYNLETQRSATEALLVCEGTNSVNSFKKKLKHFVFRIYYT